MTPPRIVVLGATGFIDRNLVRLFESEGQPYCTVGFPEVDLTHPESVAALAGVFQPDDAVIVCSALTPEHGRDRATFFKNVRMADHVCDALAQSPCANLLHIGSDAVYRATGDAITEASPCETDDLYGLAHLVREKLLTHACAAQSIPLTLFRCGAIYGPGDTHNAYGPNKFVGTALAARKISLFGEGEERRDHVYIRDLARIVLLCVQRRIAGKLNAVTGNSVSFREIAETVDRVLGGGIAIEYLPRSVPIVHRRFDSAALRAALPDFHLTTLESAIAETAAARMDRRHE
jgi:nucleoside-diphosphate-sugar epimerase